MKSNLTGITDGSIVLRHGVPEGTMLIIFGASGDLTRRKLMPALYHLAREDLLPEKLSIIGLGRRIQVGPDFHIHMKHRVMQYCSHKMEPRYWMRLESKMESLKVDYYDDETFKIITEKIKEKEILWGQPVNRLFYFATNPSHFEVIVDKLAKVGLNRSQSDYWSRIIVEKPFGLDLESAINLNKSIIKHFDENQIYRIDHFLGKESVQNILIFRMTNLIFQPIWTNKYIDHVQITSAETIGVEGRVEFFEQTGAVRDMIQSHLLQILALLTIEPPNSLDQEEIRNNKVSIFEKVRKYKTKKDIIENSYRGQYTKGVVNSELVSRYTDEKGVNPNSKVETYAAIKLYIDNSRWQGVPFYLRTGKRMPKRKTEIIIHLKEINAIVPTLLDQQKPIPNMIKLEIQPKAGVEITIGWKPPGLLSEMEAFKLNLGATAELSEPKAYERLLVDAMRGDSTLFIRFDEIAEMWKIVDPFLKFWKEIDKSNDAKGKLLDYAAGTQGPANANSIFHNPNIKWS